MSTPVTLMGAVLKNISCNMQEPTEGVKITGSYNLMSSANFVLATQEFNGYNTIKIAPSPDTLAAFGRFQEHLQKDINKTLGLAHD